VDELRESLVRSEKWALRVATGLVVLTTVVGAILVLTVGVTIRIAYASFGLSGRRRRRNLPALTIQRADIVKVQAWMGHSNVKATMRYLHHKSRPERRH
jgi:hypothetical protein